MGRTDLGTYYFVGWQWRSQDFVERAEGFENNLV